MSRKLPVVLLLVFLELLTVVGLFLLFKELLSDQVLSLAHVSLFLLLTAGQWTTISALFWGLLHPESFSVLRFMLWPSKIIFIGLTPLYHLVQNFFQPSASRFIELLHPGLLAAVTLLQLVILLGFEIFHFHLKKAALSRQETP